MKLSVVIPARNEEGSLPETLQTLLAKLAAERIDHELIVVNDGSTDRTEEVARAQDPSGERVRIVKNGPPHGFGLAVRCGLAEAKGDAVAIFMADLSDDPEDLVRFFRKLEAEPELDCVFGTRFSRGGRTYDYPWLKLFVNRCANLFVRMLFLHGYDDTTNAFKLYRREVIEGAQPLVSPHFNLTVELPLKAIVRGYRFAVLPNSWRNRKAGVSKLKIKEMGSRYLFVVLYCLLEKWLARGDYHRTRQVPKPRP